MAVGYGVQALSKLFRGKPQSGMVDPKSMYNQLMMSEGTVAGMRNQALENARAANMGNAMQLRQMGAAGRAPMGSIMSALQGMNYQTGRAAASIEPQIQQQKMNNAWDYYNAQNQYGQAQQQASDAYNDSWSSDIGNLTKMAMLWQGGYFGGPGGGSGGSGQAYQPTGGDMMRNYYRNQ